MFKLARVGINAAFMPTTQSTAARASGWRRGQHSGGGENWSTASRSLSCLIERIDPVVKDLFLRPKGEGPQGVFTQVNLEAATTRGALYDSLAKFWMRRWKPSHPRKALSCLAACDRQAG